MARIVKLRKYINVRGQRIPQPATFVVTYDEYGLIDTIKQDGKALVSTNKYAKAIIAADHRTGLRAIAPVGFTFAD